MGWDAFLQNSDSYDWVSFTLTNGQTDYDLKVNQANLFKNLVQARGMVIISTQAIGVKINSTSFPLITVSVAQMPWEFLGYKIIKDAFLTNSSGSDATVEVLLL